MCKDLIKTLSCLPKEFTLKDKLVITAAGKQNLTDRIKYQEASSKNWGSLGADSKHLCLVLGKANCRLAESSPRVLFPASLWCRWKTESLPLHNSAPHFDCPPNSPLCIYYSNMPKKSIIFLNNWQLAFTDILSAVLKQQYTCSSKYPICNSWRAYPSPYGPYDLELSVECHCKCGFCITNRMSSIKHPFYISWLNELEVTSGKEEVTMGFKITTRQCLRSLLTTGLHARKIYSILYFNERSTFGDDWWKPADLLDPFHSVYHLKSCC